MTPEQAQLHILFRNLLGGTVNKICISREIFVAIFDIISFL